MAHYMDTSALAKLVVAEPETTALHGWAVEADRQLVSCDLARTELIRAARRADPSTALRVRAVLDTLILLKVTTATFEDAGRLDPSGLRSLDALHLAAALTLGDELEAVVTYDDRLAEACTANGIHVLAPGRAEAGSPG